MGNIKQDKSKIKYIVYDENVNRLNTKHLSLDLKAKPTTFYFQ